MKKQDKPRSQKLSSKSDTTVITPRYKVSPNEITHNRRYLKESSALEDSTKAKLVANKVNLSTTIARNEERSKEGKSRIQPPGIRYVESKGLNFKDRPIKVVKVVKPKAKKK